MGGFSLSDPRSATTGAPPHEPPTAPDAPSVVVSEQALHKAEEFIEAGRRRGQQATRAGWRAVADAVAVVMSLFHLYTAYAIVPTQTPAAGARRLRAVPVLPGVPGRASAFATASMWWDWLAALLAVAVVVYMIHGRRRHHAIATPRPIRWTSSSASR